MPDLDLTGQNDVLVGRRVVSNDGGHYATVLFHGKVGDTKGEWLGVEWDDSTRGKHAGTHEGVQYFLPKNSSPTSSSFIRLNKVCFVWMNYILMPHGIKFMKKLLKNGQNYALKSKA